MANKWNQHPKLPRCCASLYQGGCLKTPSSHISEETQVVKAVLLLKVWDLFQMVFVSTATIFKCTEKCQELYEKLSMFPLPRIRTPTSPIFAPLHLLLCPCCCLSIWKHVPYHVIFPPPTGVSLKRKKIIVFITTISSLCLITLTGILWSQRYPSDVQSSSL